MGRNWCAVVLVVLGLGTLAGRGEEPPTLKDDEKALQGQWDLPPGKDSDGLRLVFEKDFVTVTKYTKSQEGTASKSSLVNFTLKEDKNKRILVLKVRNGA